MSFDHNVVADLRKEDEASSANYNLGFSESDCVKPLREPAINLSSHAACGAVLPLTLAQSRQAHHGS